MYLSFSLAVNEEVGADVSSIRVIQTYCSTRCSPKKVTEMQMATPPPGGLCKQLISLWISLLSEVIIAHDQLVGDDREVCGCETGPNVAERQIRYVKYYIASLAFWIMDITNLYNYMGRKKERKVMCLLVMHII